MRLLRALLIGTTRPRWTNLRLLSALVRRTSRLHLLLSALLFALLTRSSLLLLLPAWLTRSSLLLLPALLTRSSLLLLLSTLLPLSGPIELPGCWPLDSLVRNNRSRGGNNRWPAAVLLVELLPVLRGVSLHLHLRPHGWNPRFTQRG